MNPRDRWQKLADAEAVDDPLTEADAAFVASYDDPLVDAERDVYGALARCGEPEALHATDRHHAAATIDAFRSRRRSAGWRRIGITAGSAALAVAAAVLLWTSTVAPTTVQRIQTAATVSSGTLMLDGVELRQGEAVPVDRWVVAQDKTCIALPTGQGCVAGRSRVRVHDGQLELGQGTLHFEGTGVLTGPDGAVHIDQGEATLTVDDGTGKIQAIAGAVRLQSAGTDAGPRVLPLDQVFALNEVGKPDGPLSEDEPRLVDDAPTAVEPSDKPAATTQRESAPRRSAADLLSGARGHVANGHIEQALRAYATLRRTHPGSSEAQAANVSIGQLELRRGHAKAALRAFSRYLGRGGALAEEAHWGKIRALHKLGRTAKRDAAIAALRAASPGSVYLDRAADL